MQLEKLVMISTENKFTTLRTARASAIIQAPPKIIKACKSGKTPKGNVVEIARAAGVLAGKKTSELIPYCHNITLDHIDISFQFGKSSIDVISTATAVAKTGVEMEALTSASVAALTIYDMLKPLDKNITISKIRLLEKRGGKSDFSKASAKGLKAVAIVSSDSRSKKMNGDTTGPVIQNWLKELGFKALTTKIVPDDFKGIRKSLLEYSKKCDLIITTGGTGLGSRDVTADATKSVIEKEVAGIAEALRSFGQKRTPFAMLSRGSVGIKGKTLIINLPGSPRAVQESLTVLAPGIIHAFDMMRDKKH